MKQLTFREQVQAATLSLCAGYVDAIGFLVTGGFFVSFMSGNTTRFGVGLIDAKSAWITALGLIGAFFAGAVFATLLNRRYAPRGQSRVLASVACALALAGMLLSFAYRDAGVACLAMAMGAVNLVHERDGDVRFGVTYITGALVKAAQATGNRLSGNRAASPWPYMLLWSALIIGVATGAAAFAWLDIHAIWAAVLALAMLALPNYAKTATRSQ